MTSGSARERQKLSRAPSSSSSTPGIGLPTVQPGCRRTIEVSAVRLPLRSPGKKPRVVGEAPVAQLAEARGLKPRKCRFESDREHESSVKCDKACVNVPGVPRSHPCYPPACSSVSKFSQVARYALERTGMVGDSPRRLRPIGESVRYSGTPIKSAQCRFESDWGHGGHRR
jgi:hypothetical protein